MYITVLNDGETFTDTNDTFILNVGDKLSTDEIEEVLDELTQDYKTPDVRLEEHSGMLYIHIKTGVPVRIVVM